MLATDLELPLLDPTREGLAGGAYHREMRAIEGHDGWLVRSPFGFATVDRDAGEFFLRSRSVVFPSLALLQLFAIDAGPLHSEIVDNIITINGADHARLRSLVNPALAPRSVERYRPAMRAFMAELLDTAPEDEFDFIEQIAKPYPSRVIAHVLGAPVQDAPRLHHWSGEIQKQFDARVLADLTLRESVEQAVAECYDYADALIESRRNDPGEDLITQLIGAEEAGERLNHGELRNLALNILVGGVDTSQSQLAHAVRLLAENPDQWQLLRSDPHALAASAVDEALRYEPITPFTARITVEQLEYRGVSFPANTIVLVSAWHANRDRVEDPDAFDISPERDRGRLLTFGAGIHYCVGSNLARAEIQEGLVLLAERAREIVITGAPQYGTPSGIYGLERLPVMFLR